jgi:C1A family cysteine protease
MGPRLFGPQHVFENRVKRGLGWLPDLPDVRDTTLQALAPEGAGKKSLEALHSKVVETITPKGRGRLPSACDNRQYCSPIEDQGSLGSCTAHAGMGMVEYMERRAGGKHIDGSRLFLYKATRKLLGWTGDTGAFLRTTMKALVHFGIPPEEVWPYEITTFDQEPDPFMYAYASNTRAIKYMRLDPYGSTPAETLQEVKSALTHGYAVIFGFTVYSSLTTAADIPYPRMQDTMRGGHAVLAVGYDDNHANIATPGGEKGALLIRNSWGLEWGDGGYGWLPYAYARSGLADDFWTSYQVDWVDSGQFD